MPSFNWITPKILEIRFATTYELCDNSYLFSHHYEDPEWNGKIFTRLELDEYYENKYGDAHHWKKKWAGSNLPDVTFERFIAGDFIALNKFESDLVDMVRNINRPYYVIMTSNSALYCRDHEIAHAMWHTNPEYKKEALRVVEIYKEHDKDLYHAVNQLKAAGYSDKVMDDELHVFCGIYFDHYFKPLVIPVSNGMREELVALFEKHKP